MNAVGELKKGENIQIRLENNKLREENSELRRMIDMLEQFPIEIPRWHTLRQNPIYEHFSDTEISELLLAEDWPGKMKKEHLAALNSNVY